MKRASIFLRIDKTIYSEIPYLANAEMVLPVCNVTKP